MTPTRDQMRLAQSSAQEAVPLDTAATNPPSPVARGGSTASRPPGRLTRHRFGTPTRLDRAVDAALIRGFDIVVSATLLVLLLPVIVLAIVVIRLDSPGPAFFRVKRVGYRGAPLRMLKFRKMRDDARGPNLTLDDDDRFTRVGRLLAKLKIDEIPQLWQVLTGEMSLVGPRPEDPQYVDMHRDLYRTILSVRPGITGLSQIAFAEESRILDDEDPMSHYVGRILPQKLLLDAMYARERSFALNLRILFWTAAAVLMRREVAVHRDSGKMNLRRRRGRR